MEFSEKLIRVLKEKNGCDKRTWPIYVNNLIEMKASKIVEVLIKPALQERKKVLEYRNGLANI